MAPMPEQSYERRSKTPRIGTIEHLETKARLAAESSITTGAQLQDFLQTNYIPESLAYFIFDYQTRGTRRYWVPERTAVIDTRGLTGYEPSWPAFQAEYHYEPMLSRNYICVSGRLNPRINYGYHMHMLLTDGLELDTEATLEAHKYLGDASNPQKIRSFRSSTYPDSEYDALRGPATFVEVMNDVVDGLKNYLYLRDYL
jgi:hypothetical protein